MPQRNYQYMVLGVLGAPLLKRHQDQRGQSQDNQADDDIAHRPGTSFCVSHKWVLKRRRNRGEKGLCRTFQGI